MKKTLVISCILALTALSSAASAKPWGHPKCDVDALVADYIAAFNSHDTAQVAALLDDGYAVSSPYGDFDRDGWLGLSVAAWTALPDVQWGVSQVLVDGDRFALEYTFTGTFENDFPPYAANGHVIYGRGLEIHAYDPCTCRIVETWNYSDAFGFFAQLQ